MVAPCRAAVAIKTGPAVTRLSLLARASVPPCASARIPGTSPAAPTIADITQSAGRAAAAFTAQFPRQDAAHTIYVIDPLGNLMMRFDARQNPKGLLTDIEKLLKLSHIG